MGVCWFLISPNRCENPSFDSLGHSSINNFWWQWCLKKLLSHLCPYALLLWPVSVNFPGWWTLSNSRCEWKNNPFFLSCSSDKSGPCFCLQCSPTSLHAGITTERRPAGMQQQAQPGWKKRGCKSSTGLSSTATECQAMVVTMWYNSYLMPPRPAVTRL